MLGCALGAAFALAVPAAYGHDAGWTADVSAARAWTATRRGHVAFAVRTPDGVRGVGLDRPFPSASVVKAMLLVAYLRQPAVRRRGLRAGERALLAPMIRRSDNHAATRIRNVVGNAGLERLAKVARMTRFRADPVWGRTQITARDQTRLFLHVDARVPARHRAYAMRLLRTIVAEQRWGIARAVPAGWTLWFKGGWGAGTGAVDHQVGLLRRDGDRVALAVLTVANPSHDYGRQTEEGLARRLLRGLGGGLVAVAGPSAGRLRA
jgi:hypothetical protein